MREEKKAINTTPPIYAKNPPPSSPAASQKKKIQKTIGNEIKIVPRFPFNRVKSGGFVFGQKLLPKLGFLFDDFKDARAARYDLALERVGF